MVQAETIHGAGAFMMRPQFSFRQQTLDNWAGFFAELKKEVEKSPS